ncbi:MAG TPA: phosphatase PAP2 family protein [Actinomycetes bacterium]|jgi:undecaprenyl-diphosphatase|nr:phosphatase PAP2 family protein [Actinomycetes bacterium]
MGREQVGGGARERPELLLPRHVGDLVRLAAAVALLVATAELVHRDRVAALEVDAFRLVNDLPGFLYPPVWVVMQLGNLVAVPAVAVLAALTRRFRLAVNLLVAGVGVWLLAVLVKGMVERGRPAHFLHDVHIRGVPANGLGYISGHAAVAVALASVASPYLGRRARPLVWALAITVCLSRLFVGAHLPLDVVGAAAVGWAAGALVHLLLGAPGGRPSPARVSRALVAAGLGPTAVVALGRPDVPRAARFLATTSAGEELFVKFIPSERRNQDRIYRAWRALTRRGPAGPGSGSPAEQVAREAYMVLLAAAGGVRVPRVVLARATASGDGLLVLAWVRGVPLADLDRSRLGDGLLAELWRQVGLLHAARIAHHDLNRASVVVDETDQPWLVDFDAAVALGGDRALAVDVAELLVSLATVVEPETAVAGAQRQLGLAALHEALATSRPPAGLTALTRADLHARPGLWDELRSLARAPAPVSDQRARRRGTPSLRR